jgi:hypothetical protein
MDYIALAIPLFFLLMGMEFAWSAWSNRKVYRFNDFVANMGCGMARRSRGPFTKAGISPSTWRCTTMAVLHAGEHCPSPGSSLPADRHALLLVPPLEPEVNFPVAAHIVHHQAKSTT